MTSVQPSPTDEALARETQAGSMDAFEELVLRYERRIYGFISQSCRNSMDASEITQETFIKAYQAILQFNPKRTFAIWLFTIARRKCIDHFRALRNGLPYQHSTLDSRADNDSFPGLSDTNDPAELLALEDERKRLWHIARRILPQSQFDALWLHYVEDLSVSEVGRILHRPQTYVKVLLFRARKALAERLKTSHADNFPRPQAVPHVYEISVR